VTTVSTSTLSSDNISIRRIQASTSRLEAGIVPGSSIAALSRVFAA
jgi:hypothetical protein